jgi:hypothetical protein
MSPLVGFKTNHCLFFYNLFIPSGLKAVRLFQQTLFIVIGSIFFVKVKLTNEKSEK